MAETLRPAVLLGAPWEVIPGHAHGLRGPVLRGSVRWPAKAKFDTGRIADTVVRALRLSREEVDRCLSGGFRIDAFLAILRLLEMSAQTPVIQAGMQLGPAAVRNGWQFHIVAIPSYQTNVTIALTECLASAINSAQGGLPPEQQQALDAAMPARLKQAHEDLKNQAKVFGANTVRIARACAELGLPAKWLPGGFLQAGTGHCGRMFLSTMTEQTPVISTYLARSKSLTVQILGEQGLPVPRHRLVASEDEAAQVADALGYPVVVKPDDRDQGEGVHAGLRTAQQVRQCYRLAAALSRKVLVETHVEGEDHRITVDNGRVVKAIRRVPGGVLGDGQRSVKELVDGIAASRRLAANVVTLDGEAIELLAERAMTPESVPAEGEFVALRRRANMSTGGTAQDVMHLLHPDNARLAVRAARALRLDLAGIDFLIPDISVSWLDCKSAICEVNAQPQISTEFAPEVYRDLLRRMVPAPGRMRTVLLIEVAGHRDGDAAVAEIAARLARSGERVLAVRSDGCRLGDERYAPPAADPHRAASGAEAEREATAVVAAFTPGPLLKQGLPWLYLDEVHVLRGPGPFDVASLAACLDMLAPHVEGSVVLDAQTTRQLRPMGVLSRLESRLAPARDAGETAIARAVP
ncbi:MAG TPA: acetate--CoA ligase family protein [Ramlibacter sp.]|uniref:acetate--CoA ligase family protein n=1 Tax=Ramlibacter sp. TaxID=1917967 RepID=UPI002BB17663|nr:acetate--CoA ligase family protein [Ramlibacter sp.]HVZ44057.1 acetate--CoA ligase family protein [Ramlibacter sp.]